ncbi:MAG TPA: class I SAM-dependent methyltransferase [Stellaceae bacterium]|nr:class I SAM-dependent methyltransferase [Stellaceae bacterium]
MHDPQSQSGAEPHPVIAGFYERRSERQPFVRSLFNTTAAHYDSINRLFSLGTGTRYRRRCLLRAGLRPGLRVIDVAVGTGLLAAEAIAVIGDAKGVIGVDLSEGMLAVARRKLGIPLVQGAAESLPLAGETADFLTMGYALRHVSDLVVAFREFHRVLRRGGTLLLLEIGKPTRPLSRAVVSAYLRRLVPVLSRLTTGDARARTLMRYHWETIENCVPAERILQAMRDCGFVACRCDVDLDVFRSFIGRKP